MRFEVALASGLAATLTASQAVAVETRADVETDHLDAADDGGPRALGILIHPLSMAAGWLGAEVDAACGERVVVSVEGDGQWLFGVRGYRASLGLAFYPQRFSFHGLYVHPTFQWEQATESGVIASALGGGLTVGYAWTWPVGATVRLGGGAAYAKTVVRGAGPTRALGLDGLDGLDGVRAQVDGDVGWVF